MAIMSNGCGMFTINLLFQTHNTFLQNSQHKKGIYRQTSQNTTMHNLIATKEF